MALVYRHALGEVIRERRTELKLTLRKVHKRSAVALGYISEIERGHKEASSEILNALAVALNTDVAELVISAGVRMKAWDLPNLVPTFNQAQTLERTN